MKIKSKNCKCCGSKTIKCAYCGKFISYKDIEDEKIIFNFEPSSHFGPEINEHIHKECWNKK